MEDLDVKEASKDDEKDDEDDKEVDEASDNDDEETNEATDEDEKTDESKDEEVDENFADIQPEITPEGDDDMGGDPADDMMADIEDDAEGDEPEGDEEIEDRVVDLEDALDDLKAEFEKMMGDKGEGDDEHSDDAEGDEEKEDEAIVSQGAEGETVEVAPELGDQPAVESNSNAPKSASEEIREYVNKVSVSHTDGSDSSKSPVAGKNDMGGTASNIAKGGEEKGGKAPAPKEENAGNINVPGGKAKLTAAPKAKTNVDDDKSAKSTIGS